MNHNLTFLNVERNMNNLDYDATFVGIDFCSAEWLDGVQLAANKIRDISYKYSNVDGTSYPIKVYNPESGYILKNKKINDYGNIKLLEFDGTFEKANLPIFVGGDHASTYYIIKKILNDDNITILHFDAHGDYLDEFVDCPHGSVMNEVNKLGCVNKIIHCGLHGNLNSGPGLEKSLKDGNVIITKKDLSYSNIIHNLNYNDKIYISIDIDFFDLSIAPGTNCGEPNGFLYEEFRKILIEIIKKYNIIGIDIVEYNPKMDISNITAILITNLIMECISAKKERQQHEKYI